MNGMVRRKETEPRDKHGPIANKTGKALISKPVVKWWLEKDMTALKVRNKLKVVLPQTAAEIVKELKEQIEVGPDENSIVNEANRTKITDVLNNVLGKISNGYTVLRKGFRIHFMKF